jgi:septum site-determining protein MinD
MVKRGDMLEVDDVLEILGIKLIGIVPEDEKIIVSTNIGSPISLESSRNGAGDAFRSIAKRVQGQDIPHAALESKGGLMSYLRRILGLN